MASRKTDIEVQRLVADEALASQLRTGQQLRLVQVEDSPEVQIYSDQGSLIGVVVDSPIKEQLVTGAAVIRSLRKQQNLLVHVLIRVTYPEFHASRRQAPAEAEEGEEHSTRLKQEQLQLLANSEDIGFQLKDKQFQNIIKQVDASSDSEKALKEALQQPDFRLLCDSFLSAIAPEEQQPPSALQLLPCL
ncbi:hypothetical protein CVIRNUC_004994 [Coccomyxa viridis]|uniref:Uncharacterized protein n=1 Tax=Coccomyxa viridis TaxID=1274662 RepID=A0AAV1I391_9CHLO|nr:hypothetical protein CVIRNUC_004994 [Coccomyxa viridis]